MKKFMIPAVVVGIISALSVVLFLIIKKNNPEYALLAELSAVAVVISVIYPEIKNVIDFFFDSAKDSYFDKVYVELIVKIVGISLISQLASDVCRDSGQQALASGVELAGKLIITVFTIPVAGALLELAGVMIGAD